jgi:GMP synthase-like glutamine amidotransferase
MPGIRSAEKPAGGKATRVRGKQETMEFAIIDCNVHPMSPDQGRGLGFIQALNGWTRGTDYDFIRYDGITARLSEARTCRGLILSGSVHDLALPDDSFDRSCYQQMIPVFQLIRDFRGPVLGICFGHQLMALGDDFDEGRIEFGGLRIRNMRIPRDRHRILLVRMNASLRFMNQRELWVQYNHRQEVLLNDELLEYYDIIAGSDQCPVEIMQHRSREWFGVQFHPEIGKDTQEGEISRHRAAVEDGQTLLQAFVRYALR